MSTADRDIATELGHIGSALVAGREVGKIDARVASPLRHFVRLHAISGLASHAIDTGSLEVPVVAAQGIRRDWSEAANWSDMLDRECERIAHEIVLRGLEPAPILLKGPAVAFRYGQPRLRTYLDIDLLVPAHEIDAWAGFLFELGYWAPAPEIKATRLRYQEGVALGRPMGAGTLTCDLHSSLFIERRAREVGYASIAENTEPSTFGPGLIQTDPGAQLLVLALHLVHHAKDVQRLSWLRDFVELGAVEQVEAARRLAQRYYVGWALEQALATVEDAIGTPVWNAQRPTLTPHGLAQVHQIEGTHYLRHIAMARELGPVAALRYAATRVTPRRFAGSGTGMDAKAATAWIRLAAGRIRKTPWKALLHRDGGR